jgi:hypothetical protein
MMTHSYTPSNGRHVSLGAFCHIGSRTSGLRIMFRDCSQALCVMSISRSSAFEPHFQDLILPA